MPHPKSEESKEPLRQGGQLPAEPQVEVEKQPEEPLDPTAEITPSTDAKVDAADNTQQ